MSKPYFYSNAGILEGNWTEERTGLPPAREFGHDDDAHSLKCAISPFN